MTHAAVAIENASLTVGAFALRHIDLKLDAGEILVILGPNGAGKSVSLEMIAGFHRVTAGRIVIRGREVTDLPPEQRRVSLVFQNFGLFPHLSVAGNVAFGLRARGRAVPRPAIPELLEQFGIAHLAGRGPQDLSPGEKQRVALARALATRPDLFLLDEPFSALDARTGDFLRDELKAFLRQAQIPGIFVTHDLTDAFVLADRVAVMNRGEIVQAGTLPQVFRQPATAFVADFTGVENILVGRRVAGSGTLNCVKIADKVLHVAGPHVANGSADVTLCIRAEDVGLGPVSHAGPNREDLGTATNRLEGQVVSVANFGALSKVVIDCGFRLVAAMTSRNTRDLRIASGHTVIAEIEARSIHIAQGT